VLLALIVTTLFLVVTAMAMQTMGGRSFFKAD